MGYQKKTMAECVILAGTVFVSGLAMAHETELQRQWCTGPGQSLRLLASYQWSLEDILLRVEEAWEPETCPEGGNERSCGQLDHDDYGFTRAATNSQCRDVSAQAVPVFFGPPDFLDDTVPEGSAVAQHHWAYSMVQGIQFGCYVCVEERIGRKVPQGR